MTISNNENVDPKGGASGSQGGKEFKICGSFEWTRFDDVPEAQGMAVLGIGRGALYMANVFLSASLLCLASAEAGCIAEDNSIKTDCDGKTHGFSPSSLITSISAFSGLFSAFFMPICGAIIDFTPHRRTVGIYSAITIGATQAIQIYTVSDTWFAMSILQAIAGVLLQIQFLCSFAYLPEIAAEVGEAVMNNFSSAFEAVRFLMQIIYLAITVAVASGLGIDTVRTAQFSQAFLAIILMITGFVAWKNMLPDRKPKSTLPEGTSLLLEGFKQNWCTAVGINKQYKKGLRWFLVAVTFAEAGIAGMPSILITYYLVELGYTGKEIGLLFMVQTLAALPGTWAAAIVTKRTNPNTSLKANLLFGVLITILASLVLTKERKYLGYVFGVAWGFSAGWYFPSENLFFALCLPKGQEAELTGFFVYASNILVWLPPLLVSILVESGVNLRWCLTTGIFFQLASFLYLSMCGSWEEILKEAGSKSETVEETSENGELVLEV